MFRAYKKGPPLHFTTTKLLLLLPILSLFCTLALCQNVPPSSPTSSSRLGPLTPPSFNVAEGRQVSASSTCGEVNGRPIREMYCVIAGASRYTPHNQYTYQMKERHKTRIREMRAEAGSFIQGGQNCDYCEAGTASAHPASNLVDGTPNWYQSPPLSRGMAYSEVNITIDLEQEFQIVSMFIQMANSPKPGAWFLERSADFGKTYQTWQYFATTAAECSRLFGVGSLQPIVKDDDVVCSSEFGNLVPMENAEMLIHLIEGRPSKNNFGGSPMLKQFVKATNVRLRLLRPSHLMDLYSNRDTTPDATVTRRYYYGIKELHLFGRCICNGHSANCEAQDPSRPRARLCLCEHNTEGDQCERCKSGYVQKKWRASHDTDPFVCEPCNCHGHSGECVYEQELDMKNASLDIHGRSLGGGRCQNCQHNTQGINCNQCTPGFYRPASKQWMDLDVCQPCRCDPTKHTGNCAEESGDCECLAQFTGPNCDQCAAGYYHPPECRPCDCHVNGTEGAQCLPDRPDGQCPCRKGFTGRLCDKCAPGYANITADCPPCGCDVDGSTSSECDVKTAACACKSNFGGLRCEQCAKGYYKHPQCEFCDCDPSGTEDQVCDSANGQCLCRTGFAGRRCDRCDDQFYGYPNCRECGCHAKGAKTMECDARTGACPCFANFTGLTCEKCSAGHYRFPDCLACDCFSVGSKGLTCEDGQCYCRTNFEGKRCEKCKPNFFNWPVCEECNCHPSGVVPEFAGCDKVPPGELCTCRANVQGRTCSQCKPNTWDLQAHHLKGCVDCNCNMTGTLSLFNSCDQLSGQCQCKRFVSDQKCDLCADGFYNIRADSHVGCEPCNCDVGGAIGITCHQETGQCHCRPRVGGRRCDKPIQNHFFPTLWHNRYEAEDGRLPDGKNVRYAIDANEFRNFSWRGFVVFSTIQEEIVLDVNIHKSSVYKLLVHYRNPTEVNVELEAKLVPVHTQTSDSEQFAKAVLAPSGADPLNAFIETTPDQTFVLNPGRWNLHIRSPKRLYLDYVVLIPSEYYQGQALTERIIEPCRANETENCVELLYPPIPTAAKVQAIAELDKFEEVEPGTDNVQAILSHSPSELLPTKIGHGAHVRTDDRSKEFRVTVSVPENGIYYLLVDYHSWERTAMPVRVRVQQNDITAEGILLVNHCPYAFFCREMLSAGGRAAMLGLQKSPPATTVTLQVQPGREFSIGAITLVKEEQWHNDLLGQKALCVRKNGVCVAQRFPQPPNSIRTEAEKSGKNVNSSIAGDKLPFQVAGEPSQLRVMALDGVQSTLDIEGVVASPDNYVFVIHYFSPDNPPILVDVLVQNERFGDALFHYCPSMSGCRAIVLDRHSGQHQFRLEDKYVLTFYANDTYQKGPIYIDYVVAVPQASYSDKVLRPLPLELSDEFVEKCAHNNFRNLPRNATDYCRQKIFSLTTEFNGAAQACDCNTQGSLDFACADYGGQCKCKPNVIGRKCDRCAAGYFNFPDCIKCKCGLNHQCDEKNGQCYCPRYVEGIACDRCVQYAYGYDALIGCQLCGCSINGSMGAEQRCDPLNGQCLCKENVGGRKCEHCLSGYYSFPECRECDCEQSGTTDDVCNDRSSKCLCKKNVVGPRCDQCRPGTFDLRKSDLYGCSECFCFRVTDRCRSSNWPIQMLRIPDEAWSLKIGNKSSTNGTIVVEDGRIVYAPESGLASDVLPMDVTFEARLQPGMDYTRMYGLHLSYAISSFPSSDRPKTFSQPDVRLYSTLSGEELEHWANEQPRNASQQFNVVVTLFPEYWLMSSGEPANRQQLMNILLRLDRIQVKASYYERPAKAVLEQFQMEMADSGAPARDEMGVLRPTASSVELCECPEAYTGPSCQECAQGYYRLPSQHGTHLIGACIPCQCHGHSGTCDPQTGICLNCQHNTDGEYCERCSEGFYGNATTGSAAACLRCPCPHPIESNNFATACAVSERGILQHCACREGYAGERCELCSPGFFGDPLVPNGECKRCDCNNNNDLSNPGACNPRTGDCALCEGNTDGRHCEYCKAWYWGDAVQAKNCTLCACNQCGSIDCNGQSAQCKCQPRVAGSLCDRCEDNAWGFDSCKGCTPCQCGFAASNSQCDLKTGQCACMPGAAGQLCDQCAHGFWNYGAHGCQKCDCEADLSMGTVCDVRTGQCHCQEGATGPRCDKCLPGYLRVPNFGCRFCDECVYALAQGTDAMNERLADLRNLLSNVSSEALTGARLNRVQKQMVELEPILERVVAANDPEAVELSTEITPTIGKLKENASASALRAERMVDLVGQLDKRLNDAYVKLGTVRAGGQQLVEQNRLAVEKIGNLKRRFETQAPLEISREELQAEAEQKMERIRKVDTNLANAVGQAQAKMQLLDSTIGRIQSVKNQREELRQSIDKNKTRLDDLNILKKAFQEQIATIKQMVTDVKKVTGAFSLFQLNALIDGIGKDRATANQNVTELQAQRVQISDLLAEIATKREVLNTHIARLGELRAQLTAGSEAALMMRKKRQTEGGSAGQEKRGLVISKVAQLEAEGQKIAGIYDATRLEAHRAIEAASVYGEIAQALLKARNGTRTAGQLVREARTQLHGVTETTKNVKNSINPLLNTIDSHVAIEVAATRAHADTLDGRLAALQPRVVQIKLDLAKASEAATELSEREGSLTEIDKIRDEADVAYQKIAPLNASFEEWKLNLYNVDARVDKLMTSSGSMNTEADTAKDQIQQVEKAIPMLSEEWEQVKQRLANTAERVDECRTKLGTLKERVATARDKANRIRLGAHFDQQRAAFLELPMPPADDLAVHNEIRFFFRTRESNGQLLFLGANNAQLSGEYIAVELDNERPKLTVSLGARSVGSMQLQTPVNDMQWRELAIKRMGRAVTFGLSKPGMDERAEEKTFTVDGPPKSVLNLFDDARHLFVGGIPRDFQLPAALQHNQFTGDLDKLRINGELVGFWNSERSQGVTGAEARKLADAEKSAESGVSFNGKGYMQKEVGAWNPRKRMAIMFSFMTFSPDGLLFFMGKDRDQLVLELVGGRISLSFDLGSGLVKLLSNGEQYNDGKWHLVQMDRQERSAKLKIDDTDKVEGESPGSMFEMSVSDAFYIGGLPSNIDARFTVHAFHGCMRNLKLDDAYVELALARATKGVQLGCVNKEVRIGTLLSERAYAQFTGLKLSTKQLQLSFRFRPAAYVTDRTVHLLTVFANNDQEEIVRLVIENGTTLVIKPHGAETDANDGAVIRAELGQHLLAGNWHHVSVQRDVQTLSVQVDDSHAEERAALIEDASDLLDSSEIVLAFGRLESSALSSSAHSGGFVGCLADILFGTKMLSLDTSSSNEFTLSGCTMGPPGAILPSKKATDYGTNKEVEQLKKDDNVVDQSDEKKAEMKTTQKPTVPSSQVRPEGACALPVIPHGEREDSSGMRFGLTPNARVEFALPGTLHASPVADLQLELQLRATAANGVIAFATDERHQDFTALYLVDGKPAFAFGNQQAKMSIQSARSVLDDEWHTLRVEREAGAAVLYVDDRLEVQNRSSLGTIELLQLQSPLYVGGLPPELVPLAARLLPGVKSEFGGCLREFALNDVALEQPVAETDIAQCSQFMEQGVFFGKEGGYAILSPQFVVGMSFSFELELKPRTKTAVLLSVGVLEFLSLQLLNGTVKFAVDNGAGMESVIYDPTSSSNALCDGHWHQIKIIKKKNLITLNVDGKSNLHIMKKKSTGETSTKDPLYMGGVPKDTKLRGLDTAEPYVGCMRILGIGKKQRRRRTLSSVAKPMEELTAEELTERMNLFGSVTRNACPLN